jgi:nuclear transcription factor Y gamma
MLHFVLFLYLTQKAQAQAMVQAAAQAQAVVAAAKNRGGGLVPMNAAQIAALSQIQAQAIVNARPQTALLGGSGKTDEKPTAQQLQNQIQLQAQALVHAHTQAQISEGIYKGDANATSAGAPVAAGAVKRKAESPAKPAPAPIKKVVPPPPVVAQPKPPVHIPAPQNMTMKQRHDYERSELQKRFKTEKDPALIASQPARMKEITDRHVNEITRYNETFKKSPVQQQQHVPPQYPVIPKPAITHPPQPRPPITTTSALTTPAAHHHDYTSILGEEGGVLLDPTSEEFLSNLNESLTHFWTGQLKEMHELGTDKPQNEQDFKNHNDLPLARIKRIMKSDEDVRMISAEAPVLFAKACEMFILEMTLRSWHYSENRKTKTLTKEDVREAIQRTDIFDFLVDVIH